MFDGWHTTCGSPTESPAGAVYKTAVLQHSHAATQDPTHTETLLLHRPHGEQKNLINPIIRLEITVG